MVVLERGTEFVRDHPSAMEPIAAEHDSPRRHRHPAHHSAASPVTKAISQTARMRCVAGRDFRLYCASGSGEHVQSVERRVR